MPGQCCPGRSDAKRMVVGGNEVGISGFDEVIAKGMELIDGTDEEQRKALLKELKARNYVPESAEEDYLNAIWVEFKQLRAKRLGQIEERYHGIPREEIQWFPRIDYQKCTGCGLCFKFCQKRVYTFENDEPRVTNPYRCVVSCTGCKSQCKDDAISFPSFLELREWMKELRKKYGLISE